MGELDEADHPVRRQLKRVVILVQKEVAERLTARPGDAAYSQLSVQMQYWAEITWVKTVPARCFVPAPKVDSAAVCLTPYPTLPVSVRSLSVLRQVVKAAFAHRRKTLWNNLKATPWAEAAKYALETVGLDPGLRAQAVSVAQFGALADALTL